VLGESALAKECQSLGAVSLFKGLHKVFQALKMKRLQLHMFGLYVTLLDPAAEPLGPAFQALPNRDGMVFAATLAATKAGTGSLEHGEGLLWAHGREVADQSLRELEALDAHLKAQHQAAGLGEEGVAKTGAFTVVAVPTILIEQPVTLVGMGDTISSLSLVGAR